MACPFLQNVAENCESIVNLTETDEDRKTKTEPLNYTNYLRTPILLSALKCLSHTEPNNLASPPVHEEHFFILIHQVFELWFKQLLFDIDSIQNILEMQVHISDNLFDVHLRLTRAVQIWQMLIRQLEILQDMTPVDFLEFRDYITPASGFQSHQFRLIEARMGLKNSFRAMYKENYFINTMFHNEQSSQLVSAFGGKTLLKTVEKWLEKVYDSITNPKEFRIVYREAVNEFIKYETEKKIKNGVDRSTIESQERNTEAMFNNLLDTEQYTHLLQSGTYRISQKALLGALLIKVYHKKSCFQQAYQILRLLMDIDGLISSWRHKHVLLVQRQIGRKPGTGGTLGFDYLAETLNPAYQIFIDIANLSSFLIPRRFLPNIEIPDESHLQVVNQSFGQQPIIVTVSSRKTTTNFNNNLAVPIIFFSAGCILALIFTRLSNP